MSGAAKLTRNQQLVRDHLVAAGRATTAYDILDALREEGFKAPVQVYRALEKLTTEGFVHRIESLNAYIACDRARHDSAVAFAICENCGSVCEFTQPEVMAGLGDWAAGQAFVTRQATIELTGLCKPCAAQAG